MRLNTLYCTLVTLLNFLYNCNSDIILNKEDHGYEQIQISINADLQQEDCEDIIDNIQNIFETASDVMVNATKDYYLWFKSATVVIPETWQSCGSYSVETIEYSQLSDPVIKIGSTHPIFGDNPWTSQPRQCGLPSDYMYLSQQWLQQDYDYSDKLLVEEWAKLRWGVYEEYGIQGDKIYPPVYIGEDENELIPNYCTDVLLDADIGNCTNLTHCAIEIIDPQDPAVTSSLLSLWNHSQVHEFCNESTHQASPTKHQLLCDGRSVWQVMHQHDDFSATKYVYPMNTSFSVSVKRPAIPKQKFMIVVEHTIFTNSLTNRWEFLRDSLSQLIARDISSTSSVGIVQFSTQATLIYPLTLMSDDNHRQDAVSILQELAPNIHERNKNITLAILTAAKQLRHDGIIILITTGDDLDIYHGNELQTAVDGNVLWTIVYPFNYEYIYTLGQVAVSSKGRILMIDDEISTLPVFGQIQDTNTLMSLVSALRELINNYQQLKLNEIDYDACVDETCEIFLRSRSEDDEVMLYIYSPVTGVQSVELQEINGVCEQAPSINYPTVKGFLCKRNMNDTEDKMLFKLVIAATLNLDNILAEVVSWTNTSDTNVAVWTSHDMRNIHITDSTQYMIFAQIKSDGYYVIDATVTAYIQTTNFKVDVALNDDGVLGDVTGNDGVYSGTVSDVFNSEGIFNYYVKVTNNYNTRIVDKKSNLSSTCCGSKLQLPNNLQNTGKLQYISSYYSGIVKEVSFSTFPPGRITDFVLLEIKNKILKLSFTSPGDKLYNGYANSYKMYAECTEINETMTLSLDVLPKPAGVIELIKIYPPFCGVTCMYRLSAINSNDLESSLSNEVRAFVQYPCPVPPATTSTQKPTSYLSTTSSTTLDPGNPKMPLWEILLITLGCLVVAIMLAGLTFYFVFKKRLMRADGEERRSIIRK